MTHPGQVCLQVCEHYNIRIWDIDLLICRNYAKSNIQVRLCLSIHGSRSHVIEGFVYEPHCEIHKHFNTPVDSTCMTCGSLR